jgi:D-alanyl-D-alanine carboxypeptidase/D-alanyl-D-alanine-endopeptidase (penicillin-binding protein 4)
VTDGVLRGDLDLRGVGDPMLSAYALRAMARRVAEAGIRRVTGSLWADEIRYDRIRSAPGWKPNYVPDEIGPLSALALGENGWRRDRAYLRNPAIANTNWFRAVLAKFGVKIAGPTRLGRPHGYTSVVTFHYSMTVASLVRHMLKESDNFVAEELLKEVGTKPHVPGTTAGGISVVWQWGARFRIPAGTAFDGSGLSWWDRETPRHEVRWLRAAELSSVSADFVAALPIACVDGTLKDRFCHTPAAGKVFAKTGTLPGVVCLAGYTTTASGRHVRFSFMLNESDSILAARQAIDRAVVAIVKFNG